MELTPLFDLDLADFVSFISHSLHFSFDFGLRSGKIVIQFVLQIAT